MIVNKIVHELHAASFGKLLLHGKLERLGERDDDTTRMLADVLDDTARHRFSNDEKQWIDKIESLRSSLRRSCEEILITDFGAGAYTYNYSDAEGEKRIVHKTVGRVCRDSSESAKWARLLFHFIRYIQPTVCLELGTSLGFSAAYQAAALALNEAGKLITLEGAELLAELARKNFRTLGLMNVEVIVGRFQDTLEGVLQKNHPVDYAFVDGHHQEKATVQYFKQIEPYLSENAILAFSDISWSSGMQCAWRYIKNDKHMRIVLDLFDVGVCFYSTSTIRQKEIFTFAL